MAKKNLRLGHSKTMKSSICIVNRLSLGDLGSIPGMRKVPGFVYLKLFKLQECILNVKKSSIYIFLDIKLPKTWQHSKNVKNQVESSWFHNIRAIVPE